eukprot:CAMPEP_0117696202 /NCGR_PEP_ID=MMETSP0804-20121206/28551_1 /TAXON_ID=1074897 /ORGANISM="Tetraselmis astigmatica, Strain CCMP880" /LENGTH=237 /DNA_ID=CAMNT_0005510333 /DNA_START=254 /DNA_END=967 /DNA_ORIENTATION=+
MAASSSTASPRQSYPTSTVLGNALQVNWEDYNYPPLLRIIHYQLSDVEDPVGRSAVFWAHFNHNAVCVALLLNVMGNSILAGFRVPGKRVAVLYSIFNLVLISMLGLYSFYHCYKGIATQNRRLCRRFYMSYTLLMIVTIQCSFSYSDSPHVLPAASVADDIHAFVIAACVLLLQRVAGPPEGLGVSPWRRPGCLGGLDCDRGKPVDRQPGHRHSSARQDEGPHRAGPHRFFADAGA